MAPSDRKALDCKLVTAYLLLLSVSGVTSLPEVVDYDRQEELSAPKDLINKLRQSLDRDLKENAAEALYPRVTFPHRFAYSPNAAPPSVRGGSTTAAAAKRDGRVQIRSASHEQTIRRIKNPCAGENTMPFSIGAPPTASTVNITPRNLLMTLSGEALHAERAALFILGQFEDMGITHQHTVGMLGHAPSVGFSRNLRRSYNLRLHPGTLSMLNEIYEQLAHAALILQEIVDDGGHFTELIENLKENSVYNMLCGIKIVMDAKDSSFHQTNAAIFAKSSIAEAPSDAWRLARNYVIIREVAAMLRDTAGRLGVLAGYL